MKHVAFDSATLREFMREPMSPEATAALEAGLRSAVEEPVVKSTEDFTAVAHRFVDESGNLIERVTRGGKTVSERIVNFDQGM